MAKKKAIAPELKGLTGPCAEAVADMKREGRKVQVVGRLVNGKLELDQSSLNEMAKKFPNAEMSFVAVNAPFDPVSHSVDGAAVGGSRVR
jgi:hypothetical protein